MDSMAEAVEINAANDQAYARLEKDLTAVKNDIAHLSQQIADAVNTLGVIAQSQTRRGIRRARSNVDAVIADASDSASSVATAAHDAAASAGDSLASLVEERPAASLAAAMAIGFLIGVTWRR